MQECAGFDKVIPTDQKRWCTIAAACIADKFVSQPDLNAGGC